MAMTLDGTSGVTYPGSAIPQSVSSKVIQVVWNSTKTGYYSSSQTTFSLTNLATTITPISANSKIMVIPCLASYRYGGAAGWGLYVYRNGTLIASPSANYEVYHNTTDDEYGREEWWILDTPATTSALTYTFNLSTYAASNGAGINYASQYASYVTLLEIGA